MASNLLDFVKELFFFALPRTSHTVKVYFVHYPETQKKQRIRKCFFFLVARRLKESHRITLMVIGEYLFPGLFFCTHLRWSQRMLIDLHGNYADLTAWLSYLLVIMCCLEKHPLINISNSFPFIRCQFTSRLIPRRLLLSSLRYFLSSNPRNFITQECN